MSRNLFVGIVLVIAGTLCLIIGGGPTVRGNIDLVNFIGIILLIYGIFICASHKETPKKYTDEEVAQAKKESDRMYFEEHGSWPKTDHKDKDNA